MKYKNEHTHNHRRLGTASQRVVRTYDNVIKEIEKYGHKVTVYHPKWL